MSETKYDKLLLATSPQRPLATSTLKNLQNVQEFGQLYKSRDYLPKMKEDLQEFQKATQDMKPSDQDLNELLRLALSLQQKDQKCLINLNIQGLRDKHTRLKSDWSAYDYEQFLKTDYEKTSAVASVLHVFSVLKFLSALGQTCYLWAKKMLASKTLRWFATLTDDVHLRFWHAEAVMELMTEPNVDEFRKMVESLTAFAECSIKREPIDNIDPVKTPYILRHFSRRLHGLAAATSMNNAISSLNDPHVKEEDMKYLALFRVLQLLGEHSNLLSFPGMEIQQASSRKRFHGHLRFARHKLSHICTREALAHGRFLKQQKGKGSPAGKINQKLSVLLDNDCRAIQKHLQNVRAKWAELDKVGWSTYREQFATCEDDDTEPLPSACSDYASSGTDDSASSTTSKEGIGHGIRKLGVHIQCTSRKKDNDIENAGKLLFAMSPLTENAARDGQRDVILKGDEGLVIVSRSEDSPLPSDRDKKRKRLEEAAFRMKALKIMRVKREENEWKEVVQYLQDNMKTGSHIEIAEYLRKESNDDFIALITEAVNFLGSATTDTNLHNLERTTLYALAAQYAFGTFSETLNLRKTEAADEDDFNGLSDYFTKLRNAVFHSITFDETLPSECSDNADLMAALLDHIEESVYNAREPSNMRVIRMMYKLAGYCKDIITKI